MNDSPAKQPPQRSVSENEADPGIASNHGIQIELPSSGQDGRPTLVKHISAPALGSPMRHHRRVPSRSQGVKETLDAHSHYGSSEDDGLAIHRINQYIIKQEIGRGSFGAVHRAEDQFGNEFAVKEFSKSRLRKRAQSNLLRKPNHARRSGHLAAGLGFNSPLHRMSSHDGTNSGENNSLSLIREEIAIMKKLDHNNVVSLIEVLDDPDEDSLYMVLEMCKKGVVMKVGLDERAEPYELNTCRCWFRDMILGLEYLHHQGIIHRDIKPDNCLITHDDVLKIVDFGVSEMFEKSSNMATAKSAGSPAFMPPELCVARHGEVSGRAADIWSMGVTLYCLRYGHIPFEKTGMLDLYESIRTDDFSLNDEQDANFIDLMRKILEKDPDKRITMEQLRAHPWVTNDGTDVLLSAEENCADIVEPPTEAEMKHAITGNMGRLMVVMKAVRRFKDLLSQKRGAFVDGFFGRDSRIVAPPGSVLSQNPDSHPHSPFGDRYPGDRALLPTDADSGVMNASAELHKLIVQSPPLADGAGKFPRKEGETTAHWKQRQEALMHRLPDEQTHTHQAPPGEGWRGFSYDDHAKGHAHDPLTDKLYLNIGSGTENHPSNEDELHPIVSESPGGVEFDIYEQAYQEEMDRLLHHHGEDAALHLTRRVEHIEDLHKHPNILSHHSTKSRNSSGALAELVQKTSRQPRGGFAALVREAQARAASHDQSEEHVQPSKQCTETDSEGLKDEEDHVSTNKEGPERVDSGPAGSNTTES